MDIDEINKFLDETQKYITHFRAKYNLIADCSSLECKEINNDLDKHHREEKRLMLLKRKLAR